MHLLLDGVNNFRKTIKLLFHTSATAFAQSSEYSVRMSFQSLVVWWDTCLRLKQIQRISLSEKTCKNDCKNCLLLEFQNCLSISENELNDNVECQKTLDLQMMNQMKKTPQKFLNL